MELWIRSQDKSCLVNIKAVIMLNKEIRGYYNENPNWFLGEYDNEERALEVLDEIQNLLKPRIKLITHAIDQRELKDFSREMIIQPPINELQFQEANTWVYQMPEE